MSVWSIAPAQLTEDLQPKSQFKAPVAVKPACVAKGLPNCINHMIALGRFSPYTLRLFKRHVYYSDSRASASLTEMSACGSACSTRTTSCRIGNCIRRPQRLLRFLSGLPPLPSLSAACGPAVLGAPGSPRLCPPGPRLRS